MQSYLGTTPFEGIKVGNINIEDISQIALQVDIEYLIVGGGSRGAFTRGGGGGAGGLLSGSYQSFKFGESFYISAGKGGDQITGPANSFITSSIPQLNLTSIAGGTGGSVDGDGNTGGSGGGGGARLAFGTPRKGGLGTLGQGNNGGSGSISPSESAGGGGGAFTAGTYTSFGTTSVGGAGGSGSLWLDGNYYAAGGGGWGLSAGGAGGFGGGGAGGTGYLGGGSSATTFGSGGGGAGDSGTTPGNGGNGAVIVRYAGSSSINQIGNPFVSGGYVYHTITNSNVSFTYNGAYQI